MIRGDFTWRRGNAVQTQNQSLRHKIEKAH
jgi:hypothetical protein